VNNNNNNNLHFRLLFGVKKKYKLPERSSACTLDTV